MNRKEKKLATKRIFINATIGIIQEEGISGVSIRKVAKLSGYNSATLYFYFKNLDHLILLASIRFLKDYAKSLEVYISKAKNKLEESLMIWEFFCKSSFEKPEIYKAIFFSQLNLSMTDIKSSYEFKELYESYPDEIFLSTEKCCQMIQKLDIYERNKALLLKVADSGFISQSQVSTINNMQILIYKGLLEEATRAESANMRKLLCNRAINYISHCYKPFILKEINC